MRCEDFREELFPFIDGELSDAHERAAEAHAAACADCAERARFERGLEARVGAALLGDAPGLDVSALLAAARETGQRGEGGEAPPATGGRLLRLPAARGLAAAAAVVLVAVQAAWFFCIPPFECSILQAVERTTTAQGELLRPGVMGPALAERITVPRTLAGLVLEGDPVALMGDVDRVRARFAGADARLDVVWTDAYGVNPSFRRKFEDGDLTWWVAQENDRQLVAWMCPVTRTLCTLVSDLPEERLLAIGRQLRSDGL